MSNILFTKTKMLAYRIVTTQYSLVLQSALGSTERSRFGRVISQALFLTVALSDKTAGITVV